MKRPPKKYKMRHCLTNVNRLNKTAICSICGPTDLRIKPKKIYCGNKIRASASKYHNSPRGKKAFWRRAGMEYRIHVKNTCERCGFCAEDQCQMDIHHKDGNHDNNILNNLATLCANCHRLVHWQKKDPQNFTPEGLSDVLPA